MSKTDEHNNDSPEWIQLALKAGRTPMNYPHLQSEMAKSAGVASEALDYARLNWFSNGEETPDGNPTRYYGWIDYGEKNEQDWPMGCCQYLVEKNGIGLWNAYSLNMGKKHLVAMNVLNSNIGRWHSQRDRFREATKHAQMLAREAAADAAKAESCKAEALGGKDKTGKSSQPPGKPPGKQ